MLRAITIRPASAHHSRTLPVKFSLVTLPNLATKSPCLTPAPSAGPPSTTTSTRAKGATAGAGLAELDTTPPGALSLAWAGRLVERQIAEGKDLSSLAHLDSCLLGLYMLFSAHLTVFRAGIDFTYNAISL